MKKTFFVVFVLIALTLLGMASAYSNYTDNFNTGSFSPSPFPINNFSQYSCSVQNKTYVTNGIINSKACMIYTDNTNSSKNNVDMGFLTGTSYDGTQYLHTAFTNVANYTNDVILYSIDLPSALFFGDSDAITFNYRFSHDFIDNTSKSLGIAKLVLYVYTTDGNVYSEQTSFGSYCSVAKCGGGYHDYSQGLSWISDLIYGTSFVNKSIRRLEFRANVTELVNTGVYFDLDNLIVTYQPPTSFHETFESLNFTNNYLGHSSLSDSCISSPPDSAETCPNKYSYQGTEDSPYACRSPQVLQQYYDVQIQRITSSNFSYPSCPSDGETYCLWMRGQYCSGVPAYAVMYNSSVSNIPLTSSSVVSFDALCDGASGYNYWRNGHYILLSYTDNTQAKIYFDSRPSALISPSLRNITGVNCGYDTDSTWTKYNLTATNMASAGLGFSGKTLKNIEIFYSQSADLDYHSGGELLMIDNIKVEGAVTPTTTFTYYEDFEDLNISTEQVLYDSVSGNCLYPFGIIAPSTATCFSPPLPSPSSCYSSTGTTGNPLIGTGCYNPANEFRFINISTADGYNSTKSLMVENDYKLNGQQSVLLFDVHFNTTLTTNQSTPLSFIVNNSQSGGTNNRLYVLLYLNGTLADQWEESIDFSAFTTGQWTQRTLSIPTNTTFDELEFYKSFYHTAPYPQYFKLDNVQIGAIPVNITPPPVNVTPPLNLTTNVFFNETFTRDTRFLFDKDNCTTTCTDDPACYQFTTPLSLDNDWYCWKSDNSFMSYIEWSNISDTSKIETPQGLDVYTSTTFNIGSKQKLLQAYFPVRTFSENDTISWTCDMPYQTNGQDVYLVLGNDGGKKIVISMGRDNTSVDRCTISGVPSGNCCELTDIVGAENDCKTNTKTKVSISKSDIVSRCTNITDYDFIQLDHIGLWTINQNFLGSNNYYFDDLVMFTNEARVGNNSIPIIASVTASPNPANVSQQVFWDVLAVDDDLSPDLYTAFDCEDDGVLEYSWMVNRSINGSREWIFPCSYPTTGTYTARGFVSDTTYYPSITSSGTGVVQIRDITEETNCDGFTAPSCSGSCSFFDNFNYANGIVCNSWQYLNRVPRGNMLVLDDLSPSEDFLQRDFSPINNWEHSSFVFSFDFIINSPDRITMTLSNTNGGTYNTYVYLYFDSGSIYALDSVTPYVTNLKSFNYGEMYTLYGLANYTSNKITYLVYNSTGQNVTTIVENFDNSNAVNSVSFSMEGAGATNFTIDNFIISSGLLNLNGTAPTNVSGANYVYNGDMFCGINWTKNPPKFSTQNCVERGYSTNPALSGLCLPRACLDDLGNSIFQSGTNNIFRTLVILIAIIIFAPLIILATRKR